MYERSDPSPTERAQRYLALAETADEKAFSTTGTIRENYRCLAEQWRKLARFAEEADKEQASGRGISELGVSPMGDSRLTHR